MTSSRTTWPPTTRTAIWADPELRAKFFDIEPGTGVYRRFFDIDELAGVRQEDPEVFEATHELVLSLVRDGLIDGLRVDHPDGLADPAGYLARLRDRGVDRVWVEKILDPGERLRDWPVCGTVGYEFLNDVCALFVDPEGKPALTALWEQVSGDRRSFAEVAHEAKLEQVRGPFRQEVERLARELGDLPLPGGLDSLGHALASLPVYRTYVDPLEGRVDDADRRAIEAARMHPEIAAMLLLERDAPAAFVTRFQQTTPAIMAKGVEDTAFYRYCRLLALNDVGGDPSRFGIDVEWFHASCVERAERFPLNLLTTMTHDAKRSADVRARIGALASMPDEWAAHVGRWFELTDSHRGRRRARRRRALLPVPDARRRLADRCRTDRGVHGEGAARGQAQHQLDRAERRLGGCGQTLLPLAVHRRGVPGRLRAVRAAGRGGGRARRARPARAQAHRARDPRHLRGRRARVPRARRPRQPPAGRLRLAPGDAAPAHGGAVPDAETRKLFATLRLLGLRARRPEPFAGTYEPIDAGTSTCAFVRGGDVLVAVAVRSGPIEGTIEAPRGHWRDVLRGEERSFGSRAPADDIVSELGIAVFERL